MCHCWYCTYLSVSANQCQEIPLNEFPVTCLKWVRESGGEKGHSRLSHRSFFFNHDVVYSLVTLVWNLHGSKWHWPSFTVMSHSRAEISHSMCRQKSMAAGLPAGCGMKEGGVEWERISLLYRNPESWGTLTQVFFLIRPALYTEGMHPGTKKMTKRREKAFTHLLHFWPWYGGPMTDTLAAAQPQGIFWCKYNSVCWNMLLENLLLRDFHNK